MAGPKQSSSLPTKKPKAKAAKSTTVPKPSLSSEFVVDSDDSGDEETVSREESVSETTISRSKNVPQAATKSSSSQSKKRRLPSSSPAEDDSNGSDNGKHSSDEDEKRPTKKRILAGHNERPTVASKPATAPPVSAKPSMKPSTKIKPLNKNKQREIDDSDRETDRETDSEAGKSSYESSTESESGSGKESTSSSSDKTSLQSPEKEIPAQNGVPQQRAPSFEPPDGFEPTTISIHPASKLSEILAPSNLQGKQIWHITVPESVPISSIKEVPSYNVGNGASILEHHGANYGLVPESDIEQRSNRALLLPSTQTNNYQPLKTSIVKTLHLQQFVSIPRRAASPSNPPNRLASPSDSYIKTPRQQPEGLRMRYRPFGASDDSDVESTSEPMPKAPEFRVPAPVKESSPGKKKKRHESIDSSSNVVSTVKSKKRKQSPQATAGAIENPVDVDAISTVKSNRAESSNKDPHPELNGVKPKSNLPNGNKVKKDGKYKGSKGSSGTMPSTSTSKREREKPKLDKREPPPKPATALLPLDVKKDAETIQPGEVVEGVPTTAIANAVDGTKTINAVSSSTTTTTGNDEKAKRKEEKRRRKDMRRTGRGASSLIPPTNGGEASRRDDDDDGDQDRDRDQMMAEIENAQQEAEISVGGHKGGGRDSVSRVGSGEGGMMEREKEKEKARKKREEKREKKRKRKAEERGHV